MATYTFNCQLCGEFSEWHQSIKGNKQITTCPTCHAASKRVFKPPIIFQMDQTVKKQIERGMKPQLVKKQHLPSTPIGSKTKTKRPWQV